MTEGPGAGCALVATGPLLRHLAVTGEVDILTAPAVERFLHAQISSTLPGTTVVVDLSRLEVLSAAGIGVLVRARHEANRRGVRLVADPISPRARRVLDLTGVHPAPGRRT